MRWALFLALLFGLWFAGWFAAAALVDRQLAGAIEQAGAQGLAVTCSERDVVGFPFRLGVDCGGVGVVAPDGTSARAGPLRSAAQIYDLTRHVVELSGPATITGVPGVQRADWKTLRLVPDLQLDGDVEIVSMTATDLTVDGVAGRAGVAQLAFHARPAQGVAGTGAEAGAMAADVRNRRNGGRREDRDATGRALELALRADGLDLPGTAEPFGLVAQLRLEGAYDALVRDAASLSDWARRAGRIELQDVRLALGRTGLVSLDGPLRVEPDGTLSGTLRLGVEGAADIAAFAETLDPGLKDVVASLTQGVTMMGRPTRFATGERPAVEITLERGEARLGIIPLGRVPPLR